MINPGSDLIRVATATTGTGAIIALGAAVAGYFTAAGAGLADGAEVTYVILDASNTEAGTATYSSAEPQLESRSPFLSTNSNAAISLSGSAEVYIGPSAADLIALNTQVRSIRTVSGTTDTLTAADAGRYIRCTNAAAVAVTIDDALFSPGDVITIRQAGAGTVTVTAGSGVTLNGNADTAGQHSTIQALCVTASTFDLTGGVA